MVDCPSAETLAEPELPQLQAGAKLGRFTLQKLLGMGGMGTVWAADDPQLGRAVAIKLLRAGIGRASDADHRAARLLREAKAMARLAHPNVVPVFEIGEVAGHVFLVMELVEGVTLSRWLAQPRSPAEILEVFEGAG